MIDKKITFFYQAGRIEKIKSNEPYAKEMFYGYHYFLKKYKNVKIVEFTPIKSKLKLLFRNKVEKKISNIFKLPIYWSYLVTSQNYKNIKDSDYLIFNNNRVGASLLPLLIWYRLVNKHTPTSLCFVLGLFSRTTKYKFLMHIHNFYIKLMLKNIDKFIFLSEGEINFAKSKFAKFQHKFYLIPFAIDLDLWTFKESNKEGVLFVGNDSFRNFELVEKIINKLPYVNFTIVSQFINEEELSHDNYTIYKGSWGNPAITDIGLQALYSKSKVTIIPLKNSLQPSGQSVALQSLACGTPVLISFTDGFWDTKNFQNEKNINFINDETLENWVSNISKILNMNENDYRLLTENGLKIIVEKYDLLNFSKKVEKILMQ